METGLLATLSLRYLDNLAPVFRGLAHDPANAYTVPWQWGMTGIAWRSDLIADAPESWNVFLSQSLAGKMAMLDDVREVIGAFLRYRGHSINSVDPVELAEAKRDAIAWMLPAEGSTLWIDSLVVPKSAPHPHAAHEFINYTLRPEIAAAIATATGYGSPNQGAMSLIDNPVPYPAPNELARLEIQKDLGRASVLWGEVGTEVKSA